MHLLLFLDALQEKKGFFSPTTPLSLSLLEIKKIPTQPKTHGPPRDEKIEGISLPLCYNWTGVE